MDETQDMRSQKFGVEIETKGLGLAEAARVIAGALGGKSRGTYATDPATGKVWKAVPDGSLHGVSAEEHAELRLVEGLFFRVGRLLGRAARLAGTVPKYIVCDRGPQFDCEGFKRWCKRRKVKPRFGAVGKYGSIAVIERFIRSMKNECFRRILVPMRLHAMREELALYIRWYNEHRPSQALDGRTPDEVYYGRRPANEQPRFEPRRRWPRKSLCASPQAFARRSGLRPAKAGKRKGAAEFDSNSTWAMLVEEDTCRSSKSRRLSSPQAGPLPDSALFSERASRGVRVCLPVAVDAPAA